jgi:hypothetical protein
MLSHPPYSLDLAPADVFLFPKLKIAMKGTIFEDVSSIQQIVTRELKAIREEEFSRAFDSLYDVCCMYDVNIVRRRAETILSDGLNNYFISSLCGFYGLSWGT